jgi:hypothetical protein
MSGENDTMFSRLAAGGVNDPALSLNDSICTRDAAAVHSQDAIQIDEILRCKTILLNPS